MKFQDLPTEVQEIAAQTLSGKLHQSGFSVIGKTEPAKELAREVRDAFVELYSPSDEGEGEKCGDKDFCEKVKCDQDYDTPAPGFVGSAACSGFQAS